MMSAAKDRQAELFESVVQKVATAVSPTPGEAAAEKKFAADFVSRLSRLLPAAKVIFIGSAARDTGLRGSRDIDIFAAFAKGTEDEIVAKTFAAARKCAPAAKWEKHYAEHPYLQARISGYDVEVIPCFAISPNQKIISAVDRSPLHMAYLERKLTLMQRRDVRVLKQLLKSAGIYGAEARIGGFSGYVCELLVLNYRSLYELLLAASKWSLPYVVDIEGSYCQDDRKAIARFPGVQLIVVDVTDANRNAAAAISQDSLASFITLSRAAVSGPRLDYFFPKQKPASRPALASLLKKRGTTTVCIKCVAPDLVDDIFYPQLSKTRDSICAYVSRQGFSLVDSAHFADSKSAYILLEFAFGNAPTVSVCPGPFAYDPKSVAAFVKSRKAGVVRGPYVRGGRIFVETLRRQSAVDIVKGYLANNRRLGAASHFHNPLRKAKVVSGADAVVSSVSAESLAELSGYVQKRAYWLS